MKGARWEQRAQQGQGTSSRTSALRNSIMGIARKIAWTNKHRWFEEHDLCLWEKLPNRYMLAMCAEKDWADRELSQS